MLDLNNYINDLRKNIIFLDILIEVRNHKKEKFLEKLDIQPRTFRRLKNNVTPSTEDVIKKINSELKINEIELDKIKIYNKLIKNIIKNLYYKISYDYDYYINNINEFIAENNFLQPIFMLFKVILIMNNNRFSRKSVIELIKDDFEYITNFIDYFDEDIKVLYNDCYIYKEDIDNIDVPAILNNYEFYPYSHIVTMQLYLISGKYFAKKNYHMSLVYALECEKRFILTENHNRVDYVRNNICSCYNMLGLYNLAYSYAEKLFVLLELDLENTNLLQLFLINYGLILLMKKEYKKMKDTFSREEIINLPNHVGKLYFIVLLYIQNEYDEILNIYKGFVFETESNFVRLIKYIVSKITKEKYELDIRSLSENLAVVYKEVN